MTYNPDLDGASDTLRLCIARRPRLQQTALPARLYRPPQQQGCCGPLGPTLAIKGLAEEFSHGARPSKGPGVMCGGLAAFSLGRAAFPQRDLDGDDTQLGAGVLDACFDDIEGGEWAGEVRFLYEEQDLPEDVRGCLEGGAYVRSQR